MADNDKVTSKRELLKAHLQEQTKQHIVRDAQARPQFIFTAYIEAGEGDPCICTEYVYYNATETDIKNRQERVYEWKAAWDGDFVFDPATNYDPDGDGEL